MKKLTENPIKTKLNKFGVKFINANGYQLEIPISRYQGEGVNGNWYSTRQDAQKAGVLKEWIKNKKERNEAIKIALIKQKYYCRIISYLNKNVKEYLTVSDPTSKNILHTTTRSKEELFNLATQVIDGIIIYKGDLSNLDDTEKIIRVGLDVEHRYYGNNLEEELKRQGLI